MWSNLAEYVKDSVVQLTRAVQARAPDHNDQAPVAQRRSSLSLERWVTELKTVLTARSTEPSLLISFARRGFPDDFRATVNLYRNELS